MSTTAILITCLAAAGSGTYIPNDYIDPDTGHRVVRLTRGTGSYSSFYFHQNAFTPDGKEVVVAAAIDGERRLYAINLDTLERRKVTDRPSAFEVAARKSRRVFYMSGATVCCTDLDTLATREIATVPEAWTRGPGLTLNADETMLAGGFAEGIEAWYEKPRSEWFVGIYDAKLPNGLYTIDVGSGETKVFHRENNWLGHVQFSPTDPRLLMFCHEGPWERLQRMWVIRTDGSGLKPIHERTMEGEIAGHEFWDPSGKRVWYDLQKPMWRNFFIAGTDIDTGEETQYAIDRCRWSFHYNISRDGRLFCGDGNARVPEEEDQSKAIHLFRPKGDTLEVETLCKLTGHDYGMEPCVQFSPDARWVVFRSNMHGSPHVYAVEVERTEAAMEVKSHAGNYASFLQAYADGRPMPLAYSEGADPEKRREQGRAKMAELLAYQPAPVPLEPEVLETVQKNGYTRLQVSYNVAPGRRTEAFLLIPNQRSEKAPAVVALHDHGGFYYYGKEKIAETESPLPVLQEHIDRDYGGRTFADQLARRGFVVLVPDAFYFGSQRLDPATLPEEYQATVAGLEPGSDAYVRAYQGLAGRHEELTAKTIFDTGTTWPGILFQGDRASVDYLLTRPEVDPERIGCMGLSIGGYRSAHLFGLDPRIKAGVVAGWMTTYGSLVKRHLWCHTWMVYIPGQLNWLDLPDVATLNAPRPLMVVNCLQDILFPHQGMRDAEAKIAGVYAAMGKPEKFQCRYYDEPHSLKVPAQEDAIAWLTRWLAP